MYLFITMATADIAAIENGYIPPWQIVQNTDDSACVTAFGGLEIALWNLRGKQGRLPLYILLGGAVRKEIPFAVVYARLFRGEILSLMAITGPSLS